MIVCSECGIDIAEKAKACPACGNPNGPAKSKGLAIVLALLLGGLGIHKFYMDQPGWGFIYLIFCWTFIPAILSLIEAIIYIFTDGKTFGQ